MDEFQKHLAALKKYTAAHDDTYYFKFHDYYGQARMADLYKERELLKRMYGVSHVHTLGTGAPPQSKKDKIDAANAAFANGFMAKVPPDPYRMYEYRGERWWNEEAKPLKPQPPKPPEPERMYTDQEVYDLRGKKGLATETIASYFLWRDVAKSILVRHPDPQARITLRVDAPGSYDRIVRGQFVLGVRDTRSNDPIREGFHMPFIVTAWPGKRVAALFFTAAWATYLAHEGTELVSYRKPPPKAENVFSHGGWAYPDKDRVFNVHDTYEARHTEEDIAMSKDHWARMHACMSAHDRYDYEDTNATVTSTPAGQVVLESILGAEVAKTMWIKGVADGAKDIIKLTDQITRVGALCRI